MFTYLGKYKMIMYFSKFPNSAYPFFLPSSRFPPSFSQIKPPQFFCFPFHTTCVLLFPSPQPHSQQFLQNSLISVVTLGSNLYSHIKIWTWEELTSKYMWCFSWCSLLPHSTWTFQIHPSTWEFNKLLVLYTWIILCTPTIFFLAFHQLKHI